MTSLPSPATDATATGPARAAGGPPAPRGPGASSNRPDHMPDQGPRGHTPIARGAAAAETERDNKEAAQARPQTDPRIQQQQRMVAGALRDVARVLVVSSGKGGVGKSTVASSLAVRLSERGLKVGLLDFDLTGPDLPKFLDVEKAEIKDGDKGLIEPVAVNENLVLMSLAYLLPDEKSPIIWRGPMKMGAIRQLLTEVNWGKLDHLIIDLPPGTSDEPLSVAQNLPDADGVIIVTTPHSVSILDVMKNINFARQLGLHVLGVVENMAGMDCPDCGAHIHPFGKGLGEELAAEFNTPFLGRVPIDPHATSPDGRLAKPAMLRDQGPASRAFEGVVDAIVAETEKRPRRAVPKTGPLKMA